MVIYCIVAAGIIFLAAAVAGLVITVCDQQDEAQVDEVMTHIDRILEEPVDRLG